MMVIRPTQFGQDRIGFLIFRKKYFSLEISGNFGKDDEIFTFFVVQSSYVLASMISLTTLSGRW